MASPDAVAEARLLSRYLVNRDCTAEMAERYARGRDMPARDTATGQDVCAFAFRHPWSLPFLDAAAPYVGGAEALRSRVLLMAAVLEASPVFVTDFLPREIGLGRTLIELAGHGFTAAARLLIGAPLLLLLRRGG